MAARVQSGRDGEDNKLIENNRSWVHLDLLSYVDTTRELLLSPLSFLLGFLPHFRPLFNSIFRRKMELLCDLFTSVAVAAAVLPDNRSE